MANISIKKDFKDGDKLLAQQLNNNFSVIEAGVNANEANLENVIQDAENRLKTELESITADRGWDWNEGDRVTFFKGSEEEVANQEVKDGQLLYNETTGETYLDNEGKRIVTGSGNVVSVGSEQPKNSATKIWIDPEEIGEPLPHQLVVSPEEPATGEEVWFKKGKNLFDGNIELGSIDVGGTGGNIGHTTRTRSVGYIKVSPNTTYTIQRTELKGFRWIVGYKSNQEIISDGDVDNNDEIMTGAVAKMNIDEEQMTFTTTATTEYIRWYDTSCTNINENVQIEQGSTATEYEAYVDKEIYVKNDNGVYELFNKVEEPQYCQVQIDGNRILNFSTQYEKVRIPFDKIVAQNGNFSLEDGAIKIGKNISRIKVTFNTLLNSITKEGMFTISANVNSNTKAFLYDKIRAYTSYTAVYILDVIENDNIDITLQNQETFDNEIKLYGTANMVTTSMLIEKIA